MELIDYPKSVCRSIALCDLTALAVLPNLCRHTGNLTAGVLLTKKFRLAVKESLAWTVVFSWPEFPFSKRKAISYFFITALYALGR
jgi:hypothetical protein